MKNKYVRYYNIADVPFSVESFEKIEEREPFSLFASKKCETVTDYTISEVPSLPVPEDAPLLESSNYRTYKNGKNVERHAGFYREGKILDPEYAVIRFSEENFKNPQILVSSERKIPSNEPMLFRMLFLEHLMLVNRALILHSSYIVTKAGAVLFTAPSGTGKSTQAELWTKYRGAFTVNGDCSIIRKASGGYKAYGIPFSGSSAVCHNITEKLAAVVFLGQAPENRIKRLSGAAAFKALFEGIKIDARDTSEVALAVREVTAAAKEIPIFRLDCVPDQSAVETLENELDRLK